MAEPSPDLRSSTLLRPFYPALDGLRAIAFLMVFLVHYTTGIFTMPYFTPVFSWGWTGVDLFFILSGFLITGILYDSVHNEHYFKNFYLRRALRIFPLFYAVWITALLLTPVLHIEWSRYNVSMAAYVGNFWTLSGYLPPNAGGILFSPHHAGGPQRAFVVAHFWSLCVEEQFYLVWPAVVWLVRSRRHLLGISLALVGITPLLRILYAAHHPAQVAAGALYFVTFFRMDTLFMGAALALWLRGTTANPATIRRSASITAIGTPIVLGIGYILTGPHYTVMSFDPYICTWGFTLIAIASAAILLLAIDPESPVMHALQQRPLLFLGRISYGLYIFHMIPAAFVGRVWILLQPHHLQYLAPVLAFAGTVSAAWLSFRYLESPFLRLKSVLAPQPATPPVLSVADEGHSVQRQQPAHGMIRPTA
jgi:peptidoglycan/LPS O-acetylase OafA/YrhL